MGFWWQFASICYFIPQILTPGRAVPRIFSPKWLDMWPPWQECFHSHFKTWNNLETVSRPGNPSIINYFKTNPISLKTSTQFFVPDEKTLDTLVCADALATSRQALVKIWIARVWLGNKYARFICCRLGSAMKVTYSNLKSSLRKEVLHENCQCVLSSMYGPLI